MRKKTFHIAAGGTGGHMIPGVLIGRKIVEQHGDAINVRYICGSRDIEKKVYDSESIKPWRLRVGNIAEKFALVKHLNLAIDFFSVFTSFLLHRPCGVLAMGGKACFPVLVAARILRIPYFLHESNRIPGKVIRWFHRGARKVFLGMGGIEGPNIVVTGTPAKQRLADMPGERSIFLCIGGSQGANRLNQLFVEAANSQRFDGIDLQFQLVTGPGKLLAETGRVVQKEYEPDMPSLLSNTVAMISRAGSGSLADIMTFRIPAILVPYPFAADDHQSANARYLSEANAAIYTDEYSLSADLLANLMVALLHDHDHREKIQRNLATLSTDNAAERICEEIAPVFFTQANGRLATCQGDSRP